MRLELIHPMIVHFPIVLILGLFVFDAVAIQRGWALTSASSAGRASLTLAVAAGGFAVLAYVFGDQAYDIAVKSGSAPAGLLEQHQEIGTLTVIGIAVWAVVRFFLWWRDVALGRRARVSIVVVDAVLAGGVLLAAYYGGGLVYDHGVGVILSRGA